MPRDHRGFWIDLMSKIGPPIFAAALVGCVLEGALRPVHFALIGTGFALIFLGHRADYHASDDDA